MYDVTNPRGLDQKRAITTNLIAGDGGNGVDGHG